MNEFPEDPNSENQDALSSDASSTPRKNRARERQERRRKRNPNLRKEVFESLDLDINGLPDPVDLVDDGDTPPRGAYSRPPETPRASERVSRGASQSAATPPRGMPQAVTPRSLPRIPEPESESPSDTEPRSRRSRRNTPVEDVLPREWVPRAARQRVRQVVPADRIKLPQIDRRLLMAGLYLVGGILLVSGIILGLGLFRDDAPEIAPNALWIGTEWTYENPTAEEIQAFAQQLQDDNIGTVYAWVSWLKEDGEWAGIRAQENTFEEVRDDVRSFVTQFKEAYPNSQLLGWVSFPVDFGPTGYRLNDPELQQAVADFSFLAVTELGFDGVFLNVEQVWNDNADDFIDLLRIVRAEVGESGIISVAIPPDWSPLNADIPKPPLIRPGTEWDKEFKQRVALMTDQMAIMAYNSGLGDPDDYAEWVAYQVQAYAEAVAELNLERGPRVYIGIPTYDDELPGHTVEAENIPSAILGVERGLENSGAAAEVVEGVAIYAGWETDETEWRQFRDLWSR